MSSFITRFEDKLSSFFTRYYCKMLIDKGLPLSFFICTHNVCFCTFELD